MKISHTLATLSNPLSYCFSKDKNIFFHFRPERTRVCSFGPRVDLTLCAVSFQIQRSWSGSFRRLIIVSEFSQLNWSGSWKGRIDYITSSRRKVTLSPPACKLSPQKEVIQNQYFLFFPIYFFSFYHILLSTCLQSLWFKEIVVVVLIQIQCVQYTQPSGDELAQNENSFIKSITKQ